MPYTLNGFGTKYYGKREPAEDGSYVTTLWVTALYIPLVPLASYRVRPVGQGVNLGIHRSQNYQTWKVPFCWEQVWRIYMIAAPILIVVAWFIWSDGKKNRARQAAEDQISNAVHEVVTARQQADALQPACVDSIKSSRAQGAQTQGAQTQETAFQPRANDRCAPFSAAMDSYAARIDTVLHLIGNHLAGTTVRPADRDALTTYQAVYRIRRHQADETKEIVACMQDPSGDCRRHSIPPITASLDQEDKQVCTLLATVHDDCK